MYPDHRFRLLVTAGCLAAMLSGCGGSSNTRMNTDTGMTGGTDMQAGDTFLNAAIERDFVNSEASISDTSMVTAIEENNAGGYDVTYVVDGGTPQTVSFTASEKTDYGTWAEFNRPGSTGVPSYGIWDETGQFVGQSEFSHFNVTGWHGCLDSICLTGYVVHGDPTETLPMGTASYSGRSVWRSYEVDDPTNATRGRYKSDVSLTADFDNRSVDVNFHTWETRDPDESSYTAHGANTVVTSQNATITNTGFTADIAGAGDAAGFTGTINGQFFGSDASEVGGTGHGTNGDEVLSGWFGGEKDQ